MPLVHQMGTVVTTELIAEMAEKNWKNPPQNRAEKPATNPTIFWPF